MSTKYCTYLTVYSGNKMPMFYLGRSNEVNIRNGYRGTVTSKLYKNIWLSELAEHPELFKTTILTLHPTVKEAAIKEEYFHKKFHVHKNPMYINQATGAGTFNADIKGKKNPFYGSNRVGVLNPMFGRKQSEASRQRMSIAQEGKHSQPKTDAFKKLMSEKYSGTTMEERYGAEEAARILLLLKRPKSVEAKKKYSIAAQNRPLIPCPHCGIQSTAPNFKRWHGEKCKSLVQEVPDKL